MKAHIFSITFLVCSILSFGVNGKNSELEVDSLWRKFGNEKSAEGKIAIIGQINYLYCLEAKSTKSDSAFSVGLKIARDAKSALLEMDLYSRFFHDDEAINQDSARNYIKRFNQLAQESNSAERRLAAIIANAAYLNSNNFADSAVAILIHGLEANQIKDKNLLAAYYLRLGICYKNTNEQVKAFENLTHAISMAQTLKNNELLGQCFLHLSEFYRLINSPDMALFYDKKLYQQILSEPQVDSIQLIWCESDMAGTYFCQDDKVNGEKYFKSVIDFTVRNKLYGVEGSIFRIYRSFLVRTRSFGDLYNLYKRDFPEEYASVLKQNACEFNRISAFMQEGHGDLDSARYFYKQAEQCILANPGQKIFISNFLKRYGEFLLREGDLAGAKKEFLLSLQYAQSANYLPFMVDATTYLDSICSVQKDYAQAYSFSRLNKVYTDSLAKSNRNGQLLQMEIKNEGDQIIYADEQEKLKIETKHRLQLVLFLAGIVFMVIIVIVVQRNYRIQQKLNGLLSKEKKRSEDLLLNILPESVAEELKDKGSAEARFFDPVTVMFTDFKNFTIVSERLTPQQLVNELDCCFRGFDLIMKKYGIEKIKTVGDAYLAVSGLPVSDSLHAIKAVKAAHEIADFMKARKEQLGDDTFGIRIGLHSGGLVAGIVGVSKFAYDVWGDTVNTAARMEQNCEPGRVNISESTYQLVKNHFTCTHRGKIAAKNKGDLNMYFVD